MDNRTNIILDDSIVRILSTKTTGSILVRIILSGLKGRGKETRTDIPTSEPCCGKDHR